MKDKYKFKEKYKFKDKYKFKNTYKFETYSKKFTKPINQRKTKITVRQQKNGNRPINVCFRTLLSVVYKYVVNIRINNEERRSRTCFVRKFSNSSRGHR